MTTLYSDLKAGYLADWAKLEIRPERLKAANGQAKLILANRQRLEAAAASAKMNGPYAWVALGLVLLREAGRIDFSKYIGNGQSLKIRTTIVPIGRGPFATFEQGVSDYAHLEGFDHFDWSSNEWVARVAYVLEKTNGFGYRLYHHERSPYLVAGSNLQTAGKYVSDGEFDAAEMDKQIGGLVVLKALLALDPSIAVSKTLPPVAGGAMVGVPAILFATVTSDVFVGAMIGAIAMGAVALYCEKGSTTMDQILKSIFGANRKTNSAGTVTLLGALSDLYFMYLNKSWDIQHILTIDIPAIAMALGLFNAKDNDVTGGSERNSGPIVTQRPTSRDPNS